MYCVSRPCSEVVATAAACEFTITDAQIPLGGANSIVGRAVVIHALEDDLGKGDSTEIGTQVRRCRLTLAWPQLDPSLSPA